MRSVGTNWSAHFHTDERHAGNIHGALAMPLDDTARGFFADRAGVRDFKHGLIEQGAERAAWTNGSPCGFGGRKSDGARALASERGRRGELAADDGNHASGPIVGVIV